MRRLGRKGFTLIEMLVVLVVIGFLVAIAIPRFFGISDEAKARQCEANIKSMNTAIELYNHRTGDYPASLTDVTKDTDYFPDGEPTCALGTAYVGVVINGKIAYVTAHTH